MLCQCLSAVGLPPRVDYPYQDLLTQDNSVGHAMRVLFRYGSPPYLALTTPHPYHTLTTPLHLSYLYRTLQLHNLTSPNLTSRHLNLTLAQFILAHLSSPHLILP